MSVKIALPNVNLLVSLDGPSLMHHQTAHAAILHQA
jgi:hypothetical protein